MMNTRFFPLLFLAAMLIYCSCDNAAGFRSDRERATDSLNMAAADKIWQAYETGNVSKLDSVVSTSFVNHMELGDKRGIDSLKIVIRWMHDNISDLRMSKEREWADGDLVGVWVHFSGVNTVAGAGCPMGEFMIRGIELTKFYNGKAVERWFFYDSQTVTDIISRLHEMAPQNKVADSTGIAADSLKKADSAHNK